ncbi:hypothetical protein AB6A40_006550 [Gnathostoma spinigerum]|uniref:Uncharacterized protein n=1 Tax=Gnathostoma spinigerum TaxID=75299 RepID=A0ABD6EQX7_9BILA
MDWSRCLSYRFQVVSQHGFSDAMIAIISDPSRSFRLSRRVREYFQCSWLEEPNVGNSQEHIQFSLSVEPKLTPLTLHSLRMYNDVLGCPLIGASFCRGLQPQASLDVCVPIENVESVNTHDVRDYP